MGKIPLFRRCHIPLSSVAVKVLTVLLAVTLVAHAAPNDPGRVAIDFLEKVRERKLNLEPGGDTALSAQTAERKRRQIAKRLERVARDLGSDALEVGAVKQDDDFAAVLVRKVGGFDPGSMKVFPVALVRRESGWEAAPVPASFENADAGYAIALRNRIEQLENWMLRQQVLDLEKLQADAGRRMRTRIEASLPEAELRQFNVRQVGEKFLSACGTADLPMMLGLIGGLGSKLPADWSIRLRAAERALTAVSKASRPWRLMVAPEVARAMVNDEDDGTRGMISIACLDPAGVGESAPRIEVIHFELTRSADGLWRLDPPPAFLDESLARANDRDEEDVQTPEDHPDSELIREFPAAWSEAHPAAPQPTAELASKAWLDALGGGKFPAFLAISRIDGKPSAAAKACIKAAHVWWTTRKGSSVDLAMPLAFHADETDAAGIYQMFSPRDPDRLDLENLYFKKSADGWLWTPNPSNGTREKQAEWVEAESRRMPDLWQQQVLSQCPVIGNDAALEAPTEEEARKCVESWLAAIQHGDVPAAIRQIARLGGARSSASALQNLGYEITELRGGPGAAAITAVYQGKLWSAVGVRMERNGGKAVFPLYPVVKTPQGPRILVEVSLFATSKRSRDFLNKDALVRLGKETTESAGSELQELLKRHQTAVEGAAGNPLD